MIALDQLESALWGAAVLLRGKINATGYKEYIFPLVFFKRISDVHNEERARALELGGGDEEFADQPENYSFVIPRGCLWEDVRGVTENVGQALVTAWTRIEQANPGSVVGNRVVDGLAGIFGKRDHWTNKNLLPDATVSELVEHFSKLDLSLANCPADEMGTAYEYLVGKFADDAGHTAQEFYTNRTVVELMAEILDPQSGESIYDPTCGTGGMLVSCIARCKRNNGNWREIKAYGQEQNALTAAIARMNLFLHGIEEFRVVNDDTLQHPGFLNAGRLKTFDVVLANPPYSIKQWNRDLFANDPFNRNFLGTPPQGRADYAFVQHIFKSMNPKTGRCAILLPHGVLFREEEREIRKNLVESDLLEAVIGLGPNLFYNSPMEACIMICRARKSKQAKGRVLFINAVNEVTRKNAASNLEPHHIAKILDAYLKRTSDGVFAYDATNEEIVGRDHSLAISLYAHAPTANERKTVSLDAAMAAFSQSSSEVHDMLAEFAAALDDGQAERQAMRSFCLPPNSLGSRDGWISVKLGDVAQEVRDNWEGSTKDVPVVGLEHLDPGEICLGHWDVNPPENTFTKAFRNGQLLLGRRRVYQRKLSLATCDGICSGDITVIEANPKKIDPRLLPFCLRTDRFFDYAMQGSAGSLSPRVKWSHLANYEFALPPIECQRELADLLWVANDLKEAYKKAIAATDEMLKAKFREMFGDAIGVSSAKMKWPMVCLGDVVTFQTSGSRGWAKYYSDSGEYFLTIKNVRGGKINIANVQHVKAPQDAEAERTKVQEGDLLLSITADLGRTGVVTPEIASHGAYMNQHLVCLRLDSSKVFPKYAAFYLESPTGHLQFVANNQQSVKAGMNFDTVKSLQIPLPPLCLQREFMSIAEKAETARSALKKSIADLEQGMKGLING